MQFLQVAQIVGLAFYSASLFLFLVTASSTAAWMLYAWSSPAVWERTHFIRRSGRPHSLRFSLIVPARHEEAVLRSTLLGLASLDYSRYEVIVVVGDDDPETAAVAADMVKQFPGVFRIVTDYSSPKNKPKALNAAIPECTGDIVGVFDAEDIVNPRLLACVDECFSATEAHAVQAGVQLVNFQSSWFSVRNVLEYFFWFQSRLHYQARRLFVPLGGNTVFVRTALLKALGGWDPECLAEDCDLGTRLAAVGAHVEVAYEPDLATREETPSTVGGLVRQRTRWNQGFLQVLRKGHWRALPLRQRSLAAFTLSYPYVQALTGILIPASITLAFVLPFPLLLVISSFLPLYCLSVALLAEIVGLHAFCRYFHQRARFLDYLRLVVGAIPYQLLLSYSAVRAAAREFSGHNDWEKTAHFGTHLTTDAEVLP